MKRENTMYGFALHKNSVLASVTGRRVEQAKRLEENPNKSVHRKPALERRLKRRISKTALEDGSRDFGWRPRAAGKTSDSGVDMNEVHDKTVLDKAAKILIRMSRKEAQRQKHLDNYYKWEKFIVEKPWMLS